MPHDPVNLKFPDKKYPVSKYHRQSLTGGYRANTQPEGRLKGDHPPWLIQIAKKSVNEAANVKITLVESTLTLLLHWL